MALKVYNTLSREKEEFKPINGRKVNMYACGVTPYDYSHVGHARSYVVFDTIVRYLRHSGYEVRYVQNFTDVDDKIINRARKEGDPFKATEIAARNIAAYFSDVDGLGVARADVYPKVSEHIPEIVALVEKLLGKGFAYELDSEQGTGAKDVYFDVSKFAGYGKLSHLDRDEIRAGARVEVDARKRNPEDFALWKSAKPDEPYWESPWGRGRPGWHIECSAMSMKYLGESLDIHGGGMDLIFPHHENEIAQSEAATGKPFAKYWIHHGFVTIDSEKMSKSLGNFFTIRDVTKKFRPDTLRYFLLSTHYKAPIDFSEEALVNADNSLGKLLNTLENLGEAVKAADAAPLSDADRQLVSGIAAEKQKFVAAMDDDFNTPLAISALMELSKKANSYLAAGSAKKEALSAFASAIRELGGILNVFFASGGDDEVVARLHDFVKAEGAALGITAKLDDAWAEKAKLGALDRQAYAETIVAAVADARKRARDRRDYKASDAIRARIAEIGITLEDKADGSVQWRLARKP
ncbi:MAG: cysteine--tRNA ligase [Candidatus ainarchaeum sp.]|nr:cysteine--tRNA ligase [Candidatus ainarchaeum sp.]